MVYAKCWNSHNNLYANKFFDTFWSNHRRGGKHTICHLKTTV